MSETEGAPDFIPLEEDLSDTIGLSSLFAQPQDQPDLPADLPKAVPMTSPKPSPEKPTQDFRWGADTIDAAALGHWTAKKQSALNDLADVMQEASRDEAGEIPDTFENVGRNMGGVSGKMPTITKIDRLARSARRSAKVLAIKQELALADEGIRSNTRADQAELEPNMANKIFQGAEPMAYALAPQLALTAADFFSAGWTLPATVPMRLGAAAVSGGIMGKHAYDATAAQALLQYGAEKGIDITTPQGMSVAMSDPDFVAYRDRLALKVGAISTVAGTALGVAPGGAQMLTKAAAGNALAKTALTPAAQNLAAATAGQAAGLGTAVTIGGGQQVATNYVSGRPLTEGLAESAALFGVQDALFRTIHAAGGKGYDYYRAKMAGSTVGAPGASGAGAGAGQGAGPRPSSGGGSGGASGLNEWQLQAVIRFGGMPPDLPPHLQTEWILANKKAVVKAFAAAAAEDQAAAQTQQGQAKPAQPAPTSEVAPAPAAEVAPTTAPEPAAPSPSVADVIVPPVEPPVAPAAQGGIGGVLPYPRFGTTEQKLDWFTKYNKTHERDGTPKPGVVEPAPELPRNASDAELQEWKKSYTAWLQKHGETNWGDGTPKSAEIIEAERKAKAEMDIEEGRVPSPQTRNETATPDFIPLDEGTALSARDEAPPSKPGQATDEMVIRGAYKMPKFEGDYEAWANDMIADFGPEIEAELPDIFDRGIPIRQKMDAYSAKMSGSVDKAGNLRERDTYRDQTGLPLNPLVQFADEQGKPYFVGGLGKNRGVDDGKPTDAFIKEVEAFVPPEKMKEFFQWYERVAPQFIQTFGSLDKPENGIRMMTAWLAAQQNEGPSGALRNVFRKEDQLAGFKDFTSKDGETKENLKAGLADGKVGSILQDQVPEGGFGAKLTDFSFGSGTGRVTREYMGHDASAGAPFVADVWTGRDYGFLDSQTLNRLIEKAKDGKLTLAGLNGKDGGGKPVKITPSLVTVRRIEKGTGKAKDNVVAAKVTPEEAKTFIAQIEAENNPKVSAKVVVQQVNVRSGRKSVTLNADLTGSPADAQYERAADWGNRVTKDLNARGYQGRKWVPSEVQALGWMAKMKQYGEAEATGSDAFIENTSRIGQTLDFSEGGLIASSHPEVASLPPEARAQVAREVVDTTARELAEIIGGSLRIVGTTPGQAITAQGIAPSIVIQALGSPESKGMLASALALVGKQASVTTVEFGPGGKASRTVHFNKSDGSAFTPEEKSALGALIGPGLSFHEAGGVERALITRDTGKSMTEVMAEKTLAKLGQWANDAGVNLDADHTPTSITHAENNWQSDNEGLPYQEAIVARGGKTRLRSILDYRQRYEAVVREAVDRARGGSEEVAQSARDVAPEPDSARDEIDRKAAELDRRIEARRQAQERNTNPETARRGNEQIAQRLVNELRNGGKLTHQEVSAALRIVEKLMEHGYLDNLKVSVSVANPGEAVRGGYKAAQELVQIFVRNTNQPGVFRHTFSHEVAHHLERMIPAKDLEAARQQFLRERAKWLKDKQGLRELLGEGNWLDRTFSNEEIKQFLANNTMNPELISKYFIRDMGTGRWRIKRTDETYRLTNFSEYFADKVADIAAERDDARTNPQDPIGVWARMKSFFAGLKKALMDVFGRDKVEKIWERFQRGEYTADFKRDNLHGYDRARNTSPVVDDVRTADYRGRRMGPADQDRQTRVDNIDKLEPNKPIPRVQSSREGEGYHAGQARIKRKRLKQLMAELGALERARDVAEGRDGGPGESNPVRLNRARDDVKSMYERIDALKKGISDDEYFAGQTAESARDEEPVQAPMSVEQRKARIEEIKREILPLASKGNLSREEGARYSKLGMELETHRFEMRAGRGLKLELIKPMQERGSAIPSEIVKIASDELASNRAAFDALTEASLGVRINQDTAVDVIMNGENENVSPSDLYSAFDRTREALRQQFGDTIVLYRAHGKQKQKATQNWHSTEAGAREYGSNVERREIPVDDVIAMNVGLRGAYEEFVVGKNPSGEDVALSARDEDGENTVIPGGKREAFFNMKAGVPEPKRIKYYTDIGHPTEGQDKNKFFLWAIDGRGKLRVRSVAEVEQMVKETGKDPSAFFADEDEVVHGDWIHHSNETGKDGYDLRDTVTMGRIDASGDTIRISYATRGLEGNQAEIDVEDRDNSKRLLADYLRTTPDEIRGYDFTKTMETGEDPAVFSARDDEPAPRRANPVVQGEGREARYPKGEEFARDEESGNVEVYNILGRNKASPERMRQIEAFVKDSAVKTALYRGQEGAYETPSKERARDGLIHLAADPDYAAQYSESPGKSVPENGTKDAIAQVYMNAQNVLDLSQFGHSISDKNINDRIPEIADSIARQVAGFSGLDPIRDGDQIADLFAEIQDALETEFLDHGPGDGFLQGGNVWRVLIPISKVVNVFDMGVHAIKYSDSDMRTARGERRGGKLSYAVADPSRIKAAFGDNDVNPDTDNIFQSARDEESAGAEFSSPDGELTNHGDKDLANGGFITRQALRLPKSERAKYSFVFGKDERTSGYVAQIKYNGKAVANLDLSTEEYEDARGLIKLDMIDVTDAFQGLGLSTILQAEVTELGRRNDVPTDVVIATVLDPKVRPLTSMGTVLGRDNVEILESTVEATDQDDQFGYEDEGEREQFSERDGIEYPPGQKFRQRLEVQGNVPQYTPEQRQLIKDINAAKASGNMAKARQLKAQFDQSVQDNDTQILSARDEDVPSTTPALPEVSTPKGGLIAAVAAMTPTAAEAATRAGSAAAAASTMDLVTAAAALGLAGNDRLLSGLNPIAANMHLLARDTKSPTILSVAEMFNRLGGNVAAGAQETYFEERDGNRRFFRNKLVEAFKPLAHLSEADLEALDQDIAMALAGEKTLTGAEGQVVANLQSFSDELFDYLREAGVKVNYAKDYGMPHSFNSEKVLTDEQAFLADATRAYRLNNPMRIKRLTDYIAQIDQAAANRGNYTAEETERKDALNKEINELQNAKPAEQAQALLEAIDTSNAGGDATQGLLLEAQGTGQNKADFTRERIFEPAARRILRDYFNNDPRHAWNSYIARATTLAEFARRFGGDGSKWTNMVKQMRLENVSNKDITRIKNMVLDSLGVLNVAPTEGHALAVSILGLSNMAKLKTTALTNFLEAQAQAIPGDLRQTVTSPVNMLGQFMAIISELTPRQQAQLKNLIGLELSTETGSMELARAVGLIDAAGVHEMMENSAWNIESAADFAGATKVDKAARAVSGVTGMLARTYGIEATENAKRAMAAKYAASRLDAHVSEFLRDGIFARAWDKLHQNNPNPPVNPFTLRNEAVMRLRRAGVPDSQMIAFAQWWETARANDTLNASLRGNDPMAKLARKVIRMESARASVNTNRAMKPGGKENPLVSQDTFAGKAMMTFLNYPATFLQQIGKPMIRDVKTAARGYESEGGQSTHYSGYERARMGARAMAIPAMAVSAAVFLALRAWASGHEDDVKEKPLWKHLIEGFTYTGLAGGKSEFASRVSRGQLPPIFDEGNRLIRDMNRNDDKKNSKERAVTEGTIRGVAVPTALGASSRFLPVPLAVVVNQALASKTFRDMATDFIAGPAAPKKQGSPGSREGGSSQGREGERRQGR